MSEIEINDYLSKCDEDLANNVLYRVYGMPGPIFMEETDDTPTPEPGPEPGPDYSIPFYLENTSQKDVSFTTNENITVYGTMDGINWSILPDEVTLSPGDKMYLRTNGGRAFYDSTVPKTGGNIMSLLYSSDFNGQIEFPDSDSTFRELFSGNTYLVNASELLLPATTLTDWCYANMFYNCTALTTTPSLPATTLAEGCYSDMFSNCTSLTTTPTLPATTLTDKCYLSMFSGCTALTTTPTLPATTLADGCYSQMFSGCTSLTTAPTLPATTLVYSCYMGMFAGCIELTGVPELPATTLAEGCYGDMFVGTPTGFPDDNSYDAWCAEHIPSSANYDRDTHGTLFDVNSGPIN